MIMEELDGKVDVTWNENQFKNFFIAGYIQSLNNYVFRIESEETVKGFPDVMEVLQGTDPVTYFYEFKVSDERGVIHFQKTQPAFYKRYPNMMVRVIALNRKSGRVHSFYAADIFRKNTAYHITPKAYIGLCRAEESLERQARGEKLEGSEPLECSSITPSDVQEFMSHPIRAGKEE